MLRVRTALVVFFFMFMAAGKANALTIFTANITTSQEEPTTTNLLTTSTGASTPESFGTATLVLNEDIMSGLIFAPIFNIDFMSSQTPDANGNLVATLSEPEAVSLLGIGLLVLGFVCRRGFRKR